MTRKLPLLLLAGLLAVGAACAKKQTTETSGSLLSGAVDPAEEEQREKGARADDPAQNGGPASPNPPTPR